MIECRKIIQKRNELSLKMGISAIGNQALWYNRLREHFINHPLIIVNPDEEHLVGCIVIEMDNEDEEAEKALELDLEIVTTIETDENRKKWIRSCNGMCVC